MRGEFGVPDGNDILSRLIYSYPPPPPLAVDDLENIIVNYAKLG